MKHHNPVQAVGRRNLAVVALLVLVVTLMCLPVQAFASTTVGMDASGASYSGCVTVGSSGVDASTCLPSGRWGSMVGSMSAREEPSDALGKLANFPATIARSIRNIMPNMFMMITQICWSSALATSQFAASFDPLDAAGAKLDAATAQLIDSFMSGGLLAAIAVLAIVVWVMAAAFDVWGGAKAVGKRVGAMILCFAALSVLATGASNTGKDATDPAKGSPWWVVRTINDTINDLTVSINLGGALTAGNENMMAYDNPAGTEQNCQDYLAAMHESYNTYADKETSAVTSSVNLLWEETALRSWVTMAYGNPQQNSSTSANVANNAQMAYCHVLDMKAKTSPTVQKDLTNSELGDEFINDSTAKWIFTEDGWISTLHSLVDDGKDQDDRDDNTMQSRAAVFWETCTSNGEYGTIHARDGWGKLINNIGDDGSKEIKNGGKKVRVAWNGSSLKDAYPGDDSKIMTTSGGDDAARVDATTTVCKAVLNSGLEGSLFQNKDDKGRPKDGFGNNGGKQNNTNLGDAATLGWRFDVPNVGGTWNEANLGSNQMDPNTADGATRLTIDYMYGNADPDTLGAFGSVIGGICNLVVWGLFSLILILSKLMLLMMVMFLSVAFLVRAFPIGEAPKRVLGNWTKYTCNLCMTGTLYSVLANIATFICQLALDACAGMSSSFLYNIIAGLSPVLAIFVIGMFCTNVLKIGNPFSVKAIMGIAGGGALAAGASRLISSGIRSAINGRMFARHAGFGRGRHSGAQYSSRNAGTSNGTNESEQILNNAADANNPDTATGGGQAPAAPGKPTLSQKWAQMGEDTVRGSLAGAVGRNAEKWHQFGEHLGGGGIANKLKHMSLGDGFKAAGMGLATGASLAWAAAKSKPLRNVAARAAKVAATAGVGALAFSNPITAPLGLLAAGKLATSRDTWHGMRVGLGAAATIAPKVAGAAGEGASRLAHAAGQRVADYTRRHTPGVYLAATDVRGTAAGLAQAVSQSAPVEAARDFADYALHTPVSQMASDARDAAAATWRSMHGTELDQFISPETDRLGTSRLESNPFVSQPSPVASQPDAQQTTQMPPVDGGRTPDAPTVRIPRPDSLPDDVTQEAWQQAVDAKWNDLQGKMSPEYAERTVREYAASEQAFNAARNAQSMIDARTNTPSPEPPVPTEPNGGR